MYRRVRYAALLVLLAGSVAPAGQSPTPAPGGAVPQQPTFRARVDYVEVDALVTDRQGNFIRDLQKDDFQIFEDGKPQTITNFTLIDIPVEKGARPLYAAAPIEPDVRTNEQPFDGRVYVMVIDDLHVNFQRSGRVKAAARQFIQQHLGANDLMAVVHTAGPRDANQEFTSNRKLLMSAVDRVQGRKLPSTTVNLTEEFQRQQAGGAESDPLNDPEDAERAQMAKDTLDTVRAVTEWFGGIRGRRKTLLFVSEGIDYDLSNVFNANEFSNNQASMLLSATRAVVSAATRANVTIYSIDPRGMTGMDDESIALGSFPSALPDDQGMSSKQVNLMGIGTRSLMNEVRIAQDSLRMLADETGGFAVVNRNEFDDAYDRIVTDNSSYYVLAYYPPTSKPDSYHKIEVKVNRPDAVVKARRGYTVPKANAVANPNRPASAAGMTEVLDALDSPLPVSGLAMRVFAAPFKGEAPNASVLFGVEMKGADLKPGPNSIVQVSYRAIDATGKVRAGATDNLTMNLRPETLARLNSTGLRVLKRIELPAGRYQLHVAAHDTNGGSVGSVTYDLEVPDFSKSPLDMSGIVFASPAGSYHVTAKVDELLQDVLPGPPVGIRTFATNEEVSLFTEVYDSQGDRPHTVEITTTVLSDTGQQLFKSTEQRSSSDLGGRSGGYGYVSRVPMKDLPAGAYVLRVEAKSSLGASPATTFREIPFRVEAPRRPGP